MLIWTQCVSLSFYTVQRNWIYDIGLPLIFQRRGQYVGGHLPFSPHCTQYILEINVHTTRRRNTNQTVTIYGEGRKDVTLPSLAPSCTTLLLHHTHPHTPHVSPTPRPLLPHTPLHPAFIPPTQIKKLVVFTCPSKLHIIMFSNVAYLQ